MGINYSAELAYGFALTEEDMIDIATNDGYVPRYYDSIEDAVEGYDFADEFAEYFSGKIGLHYVTGGNSYWNEPSPYVFGDGLSSWDCDLMEIDLSKIDCAKIDAICADLGYEPRWFLGCSVT